MLNMFKSRKLNEQDMKGLVFCIDNRIRVKLDRHENGKTIVSLYDGRLHDLNKIMPIKLKGTEYAQLVLDCKLSFDKGNYVKRNKRIQIEG